MISVSYGQVIIRIPPLGYQTLINYLRKAGEQHDERCSADSWHSGFQLLVSQIVLKLSASADQTVKFTIYPDFGRGCMAQETQGARGAPIGP